MLSYARTTIYLLILLSKLINVIENEVRRPFEEIQMFFHENGFKVKQCYEFKQDYKKLIQFLNQRVIP